MNQELKEKIDIAIKDATGSKKYVLAYCDSECETQVVSSGDRFSVSLVYLDLVSDPGLINLLKQNGIQYAGLASIKHMMARESEEFKD